MRRQALLLAAAIAVSCADATAPAGVAEDAGPIRGDVGVADRALDARDGSPADARDGSPADTRAGSPADTRDGAIVDTRAGAMVDARDGVMGNVADGGADVAPPAPLPGARVFDRSLLHQIDIEVADADLPLSQARDAERVPCTFTIDGVTLRNVGIRTKGYYASRSTTKPGFSVKFDEIVPGQEHDGLDKLILNNSKQDPSFFNEPMLNELHRWAGQPHARTAYGVVSLNGRALGLYVVKEAVDKTYLARNFGKDASRGNLYEGQHVDFAKNPLKIELKNEVEESRGRDDVVALANLITGTPDAQWEAAVSARLDLKGYLINHALEALVSHWDNFHYGSNNYYVYSNPRDGRFVFLTHGGDWLLSPPNSFPTAKPSAQQDPSHPLLPLVAGIGPGEVAIRVRRIPALDVQLRAEIQRLIRDVWDVPRLHAWMDEGARVIRSARRTDTAVATDLMRFEASLPVWKKYIADRKAYVLGL